MTTAALDARIRALCSEAARSVSGTQLVEAVDAIVRRLDEPLRVAIAGRVKAGKSTLLNALVGERLAPTGAGETTRLVSRYREGIGYSVRAVLRAGGERELHFARSSGQLDIALDGLAEADIERLDVEWPSSALRELTLIDTPGLASIDGTASIRTREFLGLDDDSHSEADAVLYLMRHLHPLDAEFLESFQDPSIASASPVNAIAVLSRADEVGAGRIDAMASADRIAARYRTDPRVRAMCVSVLPVAGLIAETGLTLREDEVADLRRLAGLPAEELDDLMLSADAFRGADVAVVDVEARSALLDRLGMFGLRFAIEEIRSERVRTATDLSRALVERSGLPTLRALLREHFAGRARTLKARSALNSLRAVGRRLEQVDAARGADLEAQIERVEAGAHELAELRLAHLALSGSARLSESEVAEVLRLTAPGEGTQRLGLDPGAPLDAVRDAALRGVERWRVRGENPALDPVTAQACEVAARSYEGLYVAATAAPA